MPRHVLTLHLRVNADRNKCRLEHHRTDGSGIPKLVNDPGRVPDKSTATPDLHVLTFQENSLHAAMKSTFVLMCKTG